MPGWVKNASGTVDDLNLNLCNLRNIGIEIAEREKVGFADVFRPMLVSGAEAQKRYGSDYAIAGKDGVHPSPRTAPGFAPFHLAIIGMLSL